MQFVHVMIRVKNIEKSLRFYEDLLEMKIVREKRLDDCNLYFLSDKDEKFQLELTYNDKIPEAGYNVGNGFGHFGFVVESMDEIANKIKSMGLEFLYEPYKLTSKGSTIAFIKDPDGYEIELIQKNS